MRTSVAIRPGTPADLEAITALLTDVFLTDPLMGAIAAAAPHARRALEHLHRVELADHYLCADPSRRADAVVDLAARARGARPPGARGGGARRGGGGVKGGG